MQTIYLSGCRSHFTQLPNSLLRDPNLSLRSTGLLVRILSNSSEWQVTKAWIEGQVKEGRDAISTCFRELESSGYARMVQYRNPTTNQVEKNVWTFFDSPLPEGERSNFTRKRPPAPPAGSPLSGEPLTGKAVSGEPVAKNTICSEDHSERRSSEEEIPSPDGDAASQPTQDQMPGIQCEKAKDIPEKKDKKPKAPKAPKPPAVPPDPRFKGLIFAFGEAFKDRFGTGYTFQGVKDAVAIKRLLTANPELTVDAIMGTVRFAWIGKDAWLRGQCSTIAGSVSQWNRLVQIKRPIESDPNRAF